MQAELTIIPDAERALPRETRTRVVNERYEAIIDRKSVV